MANEPKLPNSPKEMSMEVRLLLTFVLMGLVLYVTPYFMKSVSPPPPPPKKEQTSAVKPDSTQQSSKPETPNASAVTAQAAAPPAGQVAGDKQNDDIMVETDYYSVRFSNKGATVRSWKLKKYKDAHKAPVELVNDAGGARLGYPFAILYKGQPLVPDPNQALYAFKKSDDGLKVEFEFSDGRVRSLKTFQFEQKKYLVQFSSELKDQTREVQHLLAWRGGFGDFSALNTLNTQHTLYFDTSENKLVVNEVKAAKDGPVAVTGRYSFAGLEDTYFTAVALARPNTTFEVQTWNDKVPFAADKGAETPHIGVALGGDSTIRSSLYVGPKDIDILKAVDPKLEQVVDWGWFWFLAQPLFKTLNYVNDNFIHNYGWSIVVVTILINFLLMPLKISNVKSMKKMSTLQPEVKAITDKYANLPMRDPKKQMQQQEMMDLYKKHGVNPLGGCVPMALQFPFLFAFYKVLNVAIEMRGASWLWVADLSQPEQIALRVLPLATIATQFVIQRMTPAQPGADPQQQRIMMLMPLMFIVMFWSVASGLVLYWLTGNVIGIAQQWFLNKTMSVGTASKKPPEPKKSKR